MSLNIGHSSRLGYDDRTYADKIYESTSVMDYRLNPDQMYNCDNCLSTLNGRPSNRFNIN